MDLKNKVIVITGAAKGLGNLLAEKLQILGAHIISSDREEQTLPFGSVFCMADVTKESDVANLAKFAVEKFGRIDMWINNAGSWLPYMQMEAVPEDRLRLLMDVNFFGTWYGSKHALLTMKQQGSGTIVNIVSIRPLDPRAGSAAYAASKSAAAGLTKTLQMEATPLGLTIIGVYPSGIKTNLFDEMKPMDYDQYMEPEEVVENIIANFQSPNPATEQIIQKQP